MGLEVISDFKKKMELTTEELSKKSGVPMGTLNKILNGTTKDPKLETLKALARVFNCTLDDFDDKKQTSNPPISLKEQRLLKSFNKLNDLGQDKVIEYSEDLLSNYRYTVETIAAHNDFADDPEQQRLMKEDLDKL